MEGNLGVLYQDGQVGGIYDWEIYLIWDSTVHKNWQEYKVKKNITAQSYWLIKPPDGNCFDIELYNTIQGALVLMDKGNVAIDFPDIVTLDRRLYAPIEVRWLGDNDH